MTKPKSDVLVNNYPVRIYQDGEVQIDISQKNIRRHLEFCDEGLKDAFPVYLRECDLRAMLKFIEEKREIEWVDINDQLPKTEVKIWVRNKNGDEYKCSLPSIILEKGVRSGISVEVMNDIDVTHWAECNE